MKDNQLSNNNKFVSAGKTSKNKNERQRETERKKEKSK